MRPEGYVTVTGVVDGFGKHIPLSKAISYGWLTPDGACTDELHLGPNLVVDQGRQCLAYAFAGRSPIENYTCRRFGVGTGLTAPNVKDVTLEAPITLVSTSSISAAVDSVDFISAFKIRVNFTLALGDANGYAITELGLYTNINTLLARKVRSVAINKTSDFSPTLSWYLRL